MAGRNHISQNALARAHTALNEDPRLVHRIQRSTVRPHPVLIEEHVAARRREIQSLLLDNQRLAATHVALKQELAVAHQELRRLSAAAGSVKAERDAEVREVYERALNMEAEVHSIDALGVELAQVRMDVQKLTSAKQDLSSELQEIDGHVATSRAEAPEFLEFKAEIKAMHQELQRGRAAIEYEKKTHAMNLEQSQAMEKNMFSMAREIEKLRAELANAEKRARAAVAAAANPNLGYGANFGNGNMGYGSNQYPNPYDLHQFQVQDGSPYDSQQSH